MVFSMDVQAEMLLLVDAATQPHYPSVPEETFQKIKALVRDSQQGMCAAFESLNSRMNFPDPQVGSS